MFETAVQYTPNVPVKASRLVGAQRFRRSQGMDAGEKERFIRVDVADSRNGFLIKQCAFDWRGSFGQNRRKYCAGEIARQWFRTQFGFQTKFRVPGVNDYAAKFSLIGESEIDSILKMECQMLKPDRFALRGSEFNMTGHAEVDFDSASVVEVDQQVFSSSPDR